MFNDIAPLSCDFQKLYFATTTATKKTRGSRPIKHTKNKTKNLKRKCKRNQ